MVDAPCMCISCVLIWLHGDDFWGARSIFNSKMSLMNIEGVGLRVFELSGFNSRYVMD